MTTAELIAAIHVAFGKDQGLAAGEVIERSYPEADDVTAAFAGREWTDLQAEVIDEHFDSLSMLTPQAFRRFLPAFMVRGLLRDDLPWRVNDVSEFTVYSLFPKEVSPWWRERVGDLTDAQVAVTMQFVDHVRARSDGYFERPSRKAIAYWEARRRAAEQGDAADKGR